MILRLLIILAIAGYFIGCSSKPKVINVKCYSTNEYPVQGFFFGSNSVILDSGSCELVQ